MVFLTPSLSDNFTDAQHEKQDEEVALIASEYFLGQQELTMLECALLLSCIITRSEGKLKAEYTNYNIAFQLMRDNPNLESALKEAWRTKDYKEIRKSGELRASRLVCMTGHRRSMWQVPVDNVELLHGNKQSKFGSPGAVCFNLLVPPPRSTSG
ncbi:hypothetical protein F5887DRAFT_577598 [Amanita rubescens]|nr:hypothetical protein F5887DRAFT_577598 [Amanita rubescens]